MKRNIIAIVAIMLAMHLSAVADGTYKSINSE